MTDLPQPISPQEKSLGRIPPPVFHNIEQAEKELLSGVKMDVREKLAKGGRDVVAERLIEVAQSENTKDALKACALILQFGIGQQDSLILENWPLLAVLTNIAIQRLMEPLSAEALSEGVRMTEDEMRDFRRELIRALQNQG